MYLTQGLHRSVQRHPDSPATVLGERVRSFAEHAGRVARVAGGLQALGVGKGDRVGYLGLNSDRYCEYNLAVPWADAVSVPLNTRWAVPEIAFALTDSGTRVLIVDDTFTGHVEALRDQVPGLATVVHAGDSPTPHGLESFDGMAAGGDPVEDARRGGDALAGIFYTGGTTGTPKGVMLSHANVLTSAMGSLADHFRGSASSRRSGRRSSPPSRRGWGGPSTRTPTAPICSAARAAPRCTPRSASSTPRTVRCPAARRARSSCAAVTSCWVTGTGSRRRPRHCATAGATPATSGRWTATATSSCSTASRT